MFKDYQSDYNITMSSIKIENITKILELHPSTSKLHKDTQLIIVFFEDSNIMLKIFAT